MGSVIHLFKKEISGWPMTIPDNHQLSLQKGLGILGDANSNPYSPRQVLLVSEETIGRFNLKPSDLKENFVLRGIDIENLESGALLRVGESAVIRATYHCEPCYKITHLGIPLKNLLGNRGMLGVVVESGIVKTNDKVEILKEKKPSVPEENYERFLWIMNRVPYGKLLDYRSLIKMMGLPNSSFRVLPSYIKRPESAQYPIHRIVDSKFQLILHVQNQRLQLRREGIAERLLSKMSNGHDLSSEPEFKNLISKTSPYQH